MAAQLPEKATPKRALDTWFDPARFYADGYPKGVTSALKVFPQIAFDIQRIVAGLNPKRALEIGPGDRPVIGSVRGAIYLDIVPRFVQKAGGRGVVGDVRDAPFKPGSFDLVVANDVFTHIPPAERALAMAEILALSPRVLMFIPSGGARELEETSVSIEAVVDALEDEGYEVERRDFEAPIEGGVYDMALIYGARKA